MCPNAKPVDDKSPMRSLRIGRQVGFSEAIGAVVLEWRYQAIAFHLNPIDVFLARPGSVLSLFLLERDAAHIRTHALNSAHA
jgi:hypothetical protein